MTTRIGARNRIAAAALAGFAAAAVVVPTIAALVDTDPSITLHAKPGDEGSLSDGGRIALNHNEVLIRSDR